MALSAVVVTVAATPTELTTSESDGRADSRILVNNTSAVTIYLGDANVTASAGMPLAAGAIFNDTPQGERLYAVTASGTANVNVLRGGV